jgi:hypothetical protein
MPSISPTPLNKDERRAAQLDVKREVNVELLHNGAAPAISQGRTTTFGALAAVFRANFTCTAPPSPP